MVSIQRIRDQRETEMANWKADRRLYLSQEGLVVDEAAPGRKTLLAAQGSEVPAEVCRNYGIGPFAAPEAELAPSLEPDGEPEPGPEAEGPPEAHCHYWRKDGTCSCGAVKE